MNDFLVIAQTNQSKSYVHTNFTTHDGLPSNETYCIFQDSKGFVWIGTDRGVVRYDGYEFEVFTEEDGLTDNDIFGIAEDSKGNVWFTTSNRTLSYYNADKGMVPFKYNDLLSQVIDEKKPYFEPLLDCISITKSDTLYLFNRNWGYIEIPLIDQRNIANNLFSYNKFLSGELQIKMVRKKAFQQVFTTGCLHNYSKNNLHINNDFYDKVFIQKINQNDSRTYILDSNTFLINNITYSINEKQQQYYKNNMHVFTSKSKFLVNIVDSVNKGEVVLADDVNNLTSGVKILNIPIRLTSGIIDVNGGIWLSSLEKGIFYIPNLKNKIIKEGVNVTGLFPYGDNFMITERLKCLLYDPKKESFEYLQNEQLNGNILTSNARSEHSIKMQHQVQIQEVSNWIDDFDIAYSKLVSNLVFKGDTVFYIKGNGLHRYVKNEGVKILHVLMHKIKAMAFIDSERILLGCENEIYIHKKSDEPIANEYFRYDSSEPYMKIDVKPQDFKWIGHRNILAIATLGNGILFYKDKELLKKITFKDGLVSNSVNQLFLDKKDRLWVATNKGMNYIEFDELDSIYVNNYSASSRSLLSPNIQQIIGLNDSVLLVGTDGGLNEINLDFNEPNQKRYFPIFFTKSLVNETMNLKPELNYNENNIELEFTAIEFNTYGNIEYRYRLNGLSKNWTYTKERKVSFLNMQPGNYYFELEAKNENGNWISIENITKFTINKPYWETWWFRLLIFSVVGCVIYYYILNLRKEKAFVENEKLYLEQEKQLLEELNESQQKALSSQLNPHFVFNSLNSIQNFILTKRTELSSDYLSMFSKLMRFVFENSKKLYVPLLDEIEALKLYLELEQVRHNHNFEYKIGFQDLKLTQYFIPSLLIQPIIENAIWHGLLHKLEKDRQLDITFSIDKAYLHIEVKDNGVGRQFSSTKPKPKFIKKQKSSGVELTKQRLRLLSESTGLKTEFEIIDLLDNNDNSKGTLVKITIPNSLNME